jgi:hypothetical protein
MQAEEQSGCQTTSDIVEGQREPARKLTEMAELQQRLKSDLQELDSLLNGGVQGGTR